MKLLMLEIVIIAKVTPNKRTLVMTTFNCELGYKKEGEY